MRPHIIIDTETSGLTQDDELVEVAAKEVGGDHRVWHLVIPHNTALVGPFVRDLISYDERRLYEPATWAHEQEIQDFLEALRGVTLVGANPMFDAAMLERAFGVAPWHYRTLDLESIAFASGHFDDVPGLAAICAYARGLGWVVPEPDHTAMGDVLAAEAIYEFLGLGRGRTDG